MGDGSPLQQSNIKEEVRGQREQWPLATVE